MPCEEPVLILAPQAKIIGTLIVHNYSFVGTNYHLFCVVLWQKNENTPLTTVFQTSIIDASNFHLLAWLYTFHQSIHTILVPD